MKIIEVNCVAIYCSKLSECEITIDEQKEKLEKYCRHFGLEIVKEYIDDGNNKYSFNKMVADVKYNKFNIVLSYNFDTLSKDDNDLYKLVDELEKYKCELHLENTYEYIPIMKPIFKIPRHIENEINPKKKKSKGFVPIFKTYELKNPKLKEPINWVNKITDDTIRFEENPIFNKNGDYLGTSRDVYVVFKDLIRCYKPKKKAKNQFKDCKKKTLW